MTDEDVKCLYDAASKMLAALRVVKGMVGDSKFSADNRVTIMLRSVIADGEAALSGADTAGMGVETAKIAAADKMERALDRITASVEGRWLAIHEYIEDRDDQISCHHDEWRDDETSACMRCGAKRATEIPPMPDVAVAAREAIAAWNAVKKE